LTRKTDKALNILKKAIGLTDVPSGSPNGAAGFRQRDSYGEQDFEVSHISGFGGPSVIDVPEDKPPINIQIEESTKATNNSYTIEEDNFFSFLQTGRLGRRKVVIGKDMIRNNKISTASVGSKSLLLEAIDSWNGHEKGDYIDPSVVSSTFVDGDSDDESIKDVFKSSVLGNILDQDYYADKDRVFSGDAGNLDADGKVAVERRIMHWYDKQLSEGSFSEYQNDLKSEVSQYVSVDTAGEEDLGRAGTVINLWVQAHLEHKRGARRGEAATENEALRAQIVDTSDMGQAWGATKKWTNVDGVLILENDAGDVVGHKMPGEARVVRGPVPQTSGANDNYLKSSANRSAYIGKRGNVMKSELDKLALFLSKSGHTDRASKVIGCIPEVSLGNGAIDALGVSDYYNLIKIGEGACRKQDGEWLDAEGNTCTPPGPTPPECAFSNRGPEYPFGDGEQEGVELIQKMLDAAGKLSSKRVHDKKWGGCTSGAWEMFWAEKRTQIDPLVRGNTELHRETMEYIEKLIMTPGDWKTPAALLAASNTFIEDIRNAASKGPAGSGESNLLNPLSRSRERKVETARQQSDAELFTDERLKKYIGAWSGVGTQKSVRLNATGRLKEYVDIAKREIGDWINAGNGSLNHRALYKELDKGDWRILSVMQKGGTSYMDHMVEHYKRSLIGLLKKDITPKPSNDKVTCDQVDGNNTPYGVWNDAASECTPNLSETSRGAATGLTLTHLDGLQVMGSSAGRSSERMDSDKYRTYARALMRNHDGFIQMEEWARTGDPETMTTWNGATLASDSRSSAYKFMNNKANKDCIRRNGPAIKRKAQELFQAFMRSHMSRQEQLQYLTDERTLEEYMKGRMGDSWSMSFYYLAATRLTCATKARNPSGKATSLEGDFMGQRLDQEGVFKRIIQDLSTGTATPKKLEIDVSKTRDGYGEQVKRLYKHYGRYYMAGRRPIADSLTADPKGTVVKGIAGPSSPADDGLVSQRSAAMKVQLDKLSAALMRSGHNKRANKVTDLYNTH